MDVDLKFDTVQFRRVLEEYIATTSKSVAKALNSKAYQLAWHAERLTKRASRADIESLGVVATKLRRNRKTGALGKGAAVIDKPRVEAILAGLWRKQGRTFTNAELKEAAKKEIGKRLRAVGYIASGWIPAIRKLFGKSDIKLGKPESTRRAGTSGTGRAVPATPENAEAIIENSVLALKNSKVANEAEQALHKAGAIVQKDMEEYLLRKMKEAATQSGIEVR